MHARSIFEARGRDILQGISRLYGLIDGRERLRLLLDFAIVTGSIFCVRPAVKLHAMAGCSGMPVAGI